MPAAILAAILLVATGLRMHDLGAGLWFDEIITQQRVARLGALEIATRYESQNQHVLYSLLARLSIVLFGDTPAALRAPAAVFGVLSIAVLYIIGRDLLSRREALLAAALLAVSGVHVWFSQDARGYTALLFFTLLSGWLLLRALAGDQRRDWVRYGIVAALGLYVHLTMLFVLGGHLLMVLRRRAFGRSSSQVSPLSGPLVGFALAAGVALLLYVPILPSILAVNAVEGRDGGIPEWSSLRWAVIEVLRTLGESFLQPSLAVAALLLGAVGAWQLVRLKPIVLELLVLPILIGLVVVVGTGHHLWPRLFFFAIGFAALVVMRGALAVGERVGRIFTVDPRQIATAGTALAGLLVAVAATSLPSAYGPKQRYADVFPLLDGALQAGDVVLMAGPAALVYQAYFGKDWQLVTTAQQLTEARRAEGRTWLVHSFPIQLRARRGDIARELDQEFMLVKRFDGTLRGGEVLVWLSEHPPEGFTQGPR